MQNQVDKKPKWPARQPHGFDWRMLIWLPVLFFAVATFMNMSGGDSGEQLSYTQFRHAVQAGRVAAVTLHGQQIYGQFKAKAAGQNNKVAGHTENKGQQARPNAGPGAPESGMPAAARSGQQAGVAQSAQPDFTTMRPQSDGTNLMALLRKNDVDVTVKSTQTQWWQQLLISLLPWVLLIAVFIFISRRMRRRMGDTQGGVFGLGRSRAQRHRQGSTHVTMKMVAGAENAKSDVQEIIDYLRNPNRYRRLGAEIPRGVLLMGPPGTGKTLLAKAMAGEANVPFYSIGGSEFIEMFVGVGASRVRNMFAEARKESGAIIFIDELDAIGRARGVGAGGGSDEREHTLNQILSEMDGFDTTETVVVIGATNRPDVLDPALLRPGRFDRKVVMERPQREARLAILRVHAGGKPLTDDVDLPLIARRTAGFSGADLNNLVNEAALFAGQRDQKSIDMVCFDLARDKIVLGAPREERLTEEDKKVIAYHECGHALLALLLPKAEPPDRVTIIPRGRALGFTEQNPAEERYNLSESDLRDRIGVLLGGRASEKLIFGEVSTGAQQDLKQATDLVRKMVSEWGMSERLGATAFPRNQTGAFLGQEMAQVANFSEQTAEVVDAEIRRILDEADERATALLKEHRTGLEALAKRLLDSETLGRQEIESVFEEAA